MKKNNFAGFTLIEIMVVVAIIGILSAIVYASFDDARKQSRDKVREVTLKELQLSIELYKAQNGRYPAAGCVAAGDWAGRGTHDGWANTTDCPIYIVGLVPDFTSSLPSDPNQEMEHNKGYIYRTDATGSAYKLLAHQTVEILLITSNGDEFSRCPVAAGCGNAGTDTYGVYSAGAEQW